MPFSYYQEIPLQLFAFQLLLNLFAVQSFLPAQITVHQQQTLVSYCLFQVIHNSVDLHITQCW